MVRCLTTEPGLHFCCPVYIFIGHTVLDVMHNKPVCLLNEMTQKYMPQVRIERTASRWMSAPKVHLQSGALPTELLRQMLLVLDRTSFRCRDSNPGILRERQVC
jgi:hypothetical protein